MIDFLKIQTWFGSSPSGEAPSAYLLETKEEAILIPDWLKLKMIRSDCPVLVDTALRELDPQQLVLFIQVIFVRYDMTGSVTTRFSFQSFGIPVASMTKLLAALDAAAHAAPRAVADAVMDKTYMGQLVAVQHRRGAQNGEIFARALDLKLANYAEERTEQERARERDKILALGVRGSPTVPLRYGQCQTPHSLYVGTSKQ